MADPETRLREMIEHRLPSTLDPEDFAALEWVMAELDRLRADVERRDDEDTLSGPWVMRQVDAILETLLGDYPLSVKIPTAVHGLSYFKGWYQGSRQLEYVGVGRVK